MAHGATAAHVLHRFLAPLPTSRAVTRSARPQRDLVARALVAPSRPWSAAPISSSIKRSPNPSRSPHEGLAEEWRERIVKPAEGNARLVLALSAACAAPLLAPLRLEGAGIHFIGPSSIGKTTALVVAGSVSGGPRDDGGLNSYKQSWQATANAIEGLAQAHCDLPLRLDELSLVRGEDAARVGDQLASGIGRGRAFTSGLAAARLEWRVFLISTGEISLADKIADARIPQRHMPG